MKKYLAFYSTIFTILFLFSGCEKPEYSLDNAPDASELEYEVIQDFNTDPGGNTVVLRYLSEGSSPVWDYETGKSNRAVDTVRYAFTGTYTIRLTAVTQGGTVELDPVTIEVTQDNLNYVNDPLWTALSGGVGNSKTWYLDLDGEGISKYFAGPQYFYGTENGWLEGGDDGCYGEDCWNWNPDWAGNQWIMPAADYGTMTFSLDGGPFITVDHLTITARGTEEGTYFLDADAKTLTMSDATILHPEGTENCVVSWGDMKVFSLTEDYMQLGVLRKDDCDGAATLVYNFISKDYNDNWEPDVEEPEVDEGFDPTFEPGELLKMLTGGPGAGRIWKLDADGNPVDWLASGIGWTTGANDSWDWGWNQSWIDAATGSWIRFDQFNSGMNFTLNQNGTESTGTFTIDESTNEITLQDNLTLIQNPDSWMNPTTNVITVIKAFENFDEKGIWFGTSYDAGKDEWLVFHYVL